MIEPLSERPLRNEATPCSPWPRVGRSPELPREAHKVHRPQPAPWTTGDTVARGLAFLGALVLGGRVAGVAWVWVVLPSQPRRGPPQPTVPSRWLLGAGCARRGPREPLATAPPHLRSPSPGDLPPLARAQSVLFCVLASIAAPGLDRIGRGAAATQPYEQVSARLGVPAPSLICARSIGPLRGTRPQRKGLPPHRPLPPRRWICPAWGLAAGGL